ncbi:MAG: endospore germination permease [Carboxydocellales bacterium]
METIVSRITPQQLSLMLFLTILGDAIYFLPTAAAIQSGRDAWLSLCLSSLGGICFIMAIIHLMNRHPGKDIVEIAWQVAGKGLGSVMIGWYWFHSFMACTYISREFSEFLTITIMPETPILVFIVILLAIAGLAVYQDIEVMAKATEFLFPIYLLGLLLINLLAIQNVSLLELVPLLEKGWKPVFLASIPFFAWLGNVSYIMVLAPHIQSTKQLRALLSMTVLAAGAFMVTTLIITVGVFGIEQTAKMEFPFFHLGGQISVLGVLERLDPITMTIWIFGDFVHTMFFFYVTVYLLARLVGVVDYRPFVLPLVLVFSGLAITQFNNIMEIHTYGGSTYPLFAISAEVGIPLILMLLSYLRSNQASK